MLCHTGAVSGLADIDFRQLATLRAVASERSFGRAAQVLGYTQSAVSQQIAALERHVGGALFDRPGGPKPVEITPLGTLVLEHATGLLQRLDQAKAAVSGFRAGIEGTVSVGTFQSVSVRVLPAIAREFRAHHPGMVLRLHESDDLDSLKQLVRDGDLEVSFVVVGVDDDSGLELLPLVQDTFVVLCPPGDEHGPAECLDVNLLADLPMIGESGNACQRLVQANIRAQGVELDVVFRSNDNGAIAAMVSAGLGHAVMPALAVRADDPGVVVRRLDPGLPPRVIALAWRAGRTLSPPAQAFIDLARRVGTGMADDEAFLNPVPSAVTP